jgi:hypothetical protein
MGFCILIVQMQMSLASSAVVVWRCLVDADIILAEVQQVAIHRMDSVSTRLGKLVLVNSLVKQTSVLPSCMGSIYQM